MTKSIKTLQLGAAKITVITVGELQFDFAYALDVSESEWSPRYASVFEHPVPLPIQCVHIQLPEMSALVDASAYEIAPDSPFAIPNYQPPPGLLAQLTEVGIRAEDIDHVIITHPHFDHFNGTIIERDGKYEPCFPNARHYLSRTDWERAQTQEALQDPDSTESRNLGVLHRQGLLELVEGDLDLGQGLQIIAAPGETPGHQIVRVHSEGQTLYCLGDLYHHPVEVEQPAWMTTWADETACSASRQTLEAAALGENALLIATHIPTIGRLRRTGSGVRWAAAGDEH